MPPYCPRVFFLVELKGNLVGAVGIELLDQLSKSHVFTVLRPPLKRNWSQMELKSWPSRPRMVGDCPVEVITTQRVDREPQFSGTYPVQPLPPIT
jgi:hypothetical protein